MTPHVSIVMAVHNGQPYLREALSSLLEQRYGDFEFIAVDDASTDNSLELLKSIQDPRLRILQLRQQTGLTGALNAGLAWASGELIARLDADDISLPGRLEKQVAFMDSRPEVALLATGVEFISPEGEVQSEFIPPESHEKLLEATLDINPFPHSSVIFRREAALRLGGYPADYVYAQDFALWLRMLRCHRAAVLQEVLVKLRSHPSQMTLSPELNFIRTKEGLRLLLNAAAHPDLVGRAPSFGLIHFLLAHAESLSRVGRCTEARLLKLTAMLVRPDLTQNEWNGLRPLIQRILRGRPGVWIKAAMRSWGLRWALRR